MGWFVSSLRDFRQLAMARSTSPAVRRSPRLASKAKDVPILQPEGSFLRGQLSAMVSGGGHHSGVAPRPTVLQRLLMSLSSACYLGCAATWHSFGYWWLGAWFWLVAGFSIAADGLQDAVLPTWLLGPARMADRAVGSVGLATSVAVNSTSQSNAALSLLAAISAVCILAKGRSVAKAEPHRRVKYLVIHATWHVYGAAALSAITYYVQQQQA